MDIRPVAAVLFAAIAGVTVPTARSVAERGEPSGWDPHRVRDEAGAQISTMPLPTGRHVRYVAANGDDDAKGTSSRPWRTVRHAIAAAPKASVIVVYGAHPGRGSGRYSEQDWGAIETPELTIMAYPGERPVFKGSRTLLTERGAWTRTGQGWYRDVEVKRHDRWPANPFEIPDQTTDERPQAALPEQLFIGTDRNRLEALDQMTDGQRASARVVPPGRFHVERRSNNRVRVWVGEDPTGRVVEWSTRQRAVQVDPQGRDTRIVGITFINYAPHHGNTLGVVRVLANGVQLIDVEVSSSAATGIVASGENGTLSRPLRNLTLRRVTASGNGALGASIGDAGQDGADDSVHNRVTIEYSRFDENNREGFDVADCGGGANCVIAGVKLARLNGLVVRYSSFVDNASTGLWCDLHCERVAIVGNHIAGNEMSGVFYEVSGRSVIASNVIAHNGTSGGSRTAGLKLTGSTAVAVEHNTFDDNGSQEVFMATDDRVGEPRATFVANLFSPSIESGSDGADGSAVFGTLEDDVFESSWVAGSNSNGYILSADRRADSDVADPSTTLVADTSQRTFASVALGDYRVVDPNVALWTGRPMSDAASLHLRLSQKPAEVGAHFTGG